MSDSPFFISKNEGWADELLNPDLLRAVAPDYYNPKFEAIAEVRAIDDGTISKGAAFRRVASLVNVPLANAISTVLDHEWMKDKKKFYAWLDRNREYCTYQRPTPFERAAQIQRDLGNLGKEPVSG
jgi:hypothetical protein